MEKRDFELKLTPFQQNLTYPNPGSYIASKLCAECLNTSLSSQYCTLSLSSKGILQGSSSYLESINEGIAGNSLFNDCNKKLVLSCQF